MELGPTQKQWVNALRSRNYVQCTNALVEYDVQNGAASYCCLGVADKLFNLAPNSDDNLYGSDYRGVLGLRTENGGFLRLMSVNGYGYTELTQMNDDGFTFEQIANFIEMNPEVVFTHSV